MKIRTIVSLATAGLFIATSISVGAATSNRIEAKNMNKEEVQTEFNEMQMLRTETEKITEENVEAKPVMDRDRLQDCDPDNEKDQVRDRESLQDCNPDCDQDQIRDRFQDCDPDCDQDQTRNRDNLLMTQTTVVAGLQNQTAKREVKTIQNQQEIQNQESVKEQSEEPEQKQVKEMNQEQKMVQEQSDETMQCQEQEQEQTRDMTHTENQIKEQSQGQKYDG